MTAYRTPASAAEIKRSCTVPEFYVFADHENVCPGCGLRAVVGDPLYFNRRNMIRDGVSRTWKPRRWFRRVAHYEWRCLCGYRWRELPKGRES